MSSSKPTVASLAAASAASAPPTNWPSAGSRSPSTNDRRRSAAKRGACRSRAAAPEDARTFRASTVSASSPASTSTSSTPCAESRSATVAATCADNLVLATRILLARAGKADPLWVARFPETLDDFRTAFRGTVRPPRHPGRGDCVLRDADCWGSRPAARSATSTEFEHTAVLGFHRGDDPVGELPAISRAGHDAIPRRDARGRKQHPNRRTNPAAAFLRHPRARAASSTACWPDRPTTSGSTRGAGTSPGALEWCCSRTRRSARSISRATGSRSVTVERDGRIDGGDGGLLRRRGAARSHAGPRHAGAGACRAVALEARRAADRVDERHPVLPRAPISRWPTAIPSISIRTGR